MEERVRDTFLIHLQLPRKLQALVDKECRRLEMAYGGRFSRADVIRALLELHLWRRELQEHVVKDKQLLYAERDELLPHPTQPECDDQ